MVVPVAAEPDVGGSADGEVGDGSGAGRVQAPSTLAAATARALRRGIRRGSSLGHVVTNRKCSGVARVARIG